MKVFYKSLVWTTIIFLFFSHTIYAQHYYSKRKSTFIAEFSNVPDSVQLVIQNITSYLENIIYSPIDITLHITWTELKPEVLAHAKPTAIIVNTQDIPYKNIGYPIALAEKIAGRNLNFNEPDIEVFINSKINWHCDTITDVPKNSYDLYTVVLHELVHGLGFIGNFFMQNSELRIDGFPTIFDSFISDSSHHSLVELSNIILADSLKKIVTSSYLYWNGAYGRTLLGENPKLYAPAQFDPGSSIYHLDTDSYPISNSNSLMTHVIKTQEVTRTIGSAIIGILADIGWSDFIMAHKEIKNSESLLEPISFGFSYNNNFLTLTDVTALLSYDKGKNFTEIPLHKHDTEDYYESSIPQFPFEHTAHYGFRLVTTNNDTIFYPSGFPNYLHSYYRGSDTTAPTVEHKKLAYIYTHMPTIQIDATVYDDFEIDSVIIDYILGNNDFSTIYDMKTIAMDTLNFYTYRTTIAIENLEIKEHDLLAYTIIAYDKAGNTKNIAGDEVYYFTEFIEQREAQISFSTNFEDDSIQNYFHLTNFFIGKEEGFSDNALHSIHPYSPSYIDMTYSQHIAELKVPIIIQENPAFMYFDEVVLVEPSIKGVEYGEFGFWDYVVVEAKSIHTNSNEWYPLGKVGYDSRQNKDWLNAFYSNIDDENNSTTIGTGALYKNRKINLLENKYFRTGDTVAIRFRLQSDFKVYGWGWCIDNIEIQKQKTVQIPLITKDIIVFPTIFSDQISVQNVKNNAEIKLYNLHGELILHSLGKQTISTQSLAPQSYIIHIIEQGKIIHSQLVIKK